MSISGQIQLDSQKSSEEIELFNNLKFLCIGLNENIDDFKLRCQDKNSIAISHLIYNELLKIFHKDLQIHIKHKIINNENKMKELYIRYLSKALKKLKKETKQQNNENKIKPPQQYEQLSPSQLQQKLIINGDAQQPIVDQQRQDNQIPQQQQQLLQPKKLNQSNSKFSHKNLKQRQFNLINLVLWAIGIVSMTCLTLYFIK
jgi:hypothetical protein